MICIIVNIRRRVLGRIQVSATLNGLAFASIHAELRSTYCAAGGRAQAYEARFVLIDVTGVASPVEDG